MDDKSDKIIEGIAKAYGAGDKIHKIDEEVVVISKVKACRSASSSSETSTV